MVLFGKLVPGLSTRGKRLDGTGGAFYGDDRLFRVRASECGSLPDDLRLEMAGQLLAGSGSQAVSPPQVARGYDLPEHVQTYGRFSRVDVEFLLVQVFRLRDLVPQFINTDTFVAPHLAWGVVAPRSQTTGGYAPSSRLA